MNMLIGVLCEVVVTVSAGEKDMAAIRLVKATILGILLNLDEDGSGELSMTETHSIVYDQTAKSVLDAMHVNVGHLLDFLEMYFERSPELCIQHILDLILQLRGDRSPTMKDMLDMNIF